jgi:hypothetical protein
MALSPRSLSYSQCALESQIRNSIEQIQLRLITDSTQDEEELSDAVAALDSGPHQYAVCFEKYLAERKEALFAGYDSHNVDIEIAPRTSGHLRIWTGWPGWSLKKAAVVYPESCVW